MTFLFHHKNRSIQAARLHDAFYTTYFGHFDLARLLFKRGMAVIYLVVFFAVGKQATPFLGGRDLFPFQTFSNARPSARHQASFTGATPAGCFRPCPGRPRALRLRPVRAYRLCCKIQTWLCRSRRCPTSQISSKLEIEPLSDDCDGFRERTGINAESALNNARLAANVLRETDDCGLAF